MHTTPPAAPIETQVAEAFSVIIETVDDGETSNDHGDTHADADVDADADTGDTAVRLDLKDMLEGVIYKHSGDVPTYRIQLRPERPEFRGTVAEIRRADAIPLRPDSTEARKLKSIKHDYRCSSAFDLSLPYRL